jgi:hypothetical protein
MGIHKKGPGVSALAFLKDLGEILGYFPSTEEPMFPGDPNSPQLDLTWRRNADARFPLFILEVESVSAKTASDNALKVFARKTPAFEKPLFFFHIFLDDTVGPRRIDYLKDNYDKLNYGTYLLNAKADCFRLIKDILEQHIRLNPFFDLYSVIDLLQLQGVLNVSVADVFNLLLDSGYDRVNGANFLLTLESLIVNRNYTAVRDYYLIYLNRYLADESRVSQKYSYSVSRSYSRVIHHGLALLLDPAPKHTEIFQRLRDIEDNFQPWRLWEPYFGLSQDHDLVLLSEFPLILTLLCAAFSPSSHAIYFSQKLAGILAEIRNFTHFNIHGLVLLLIASRIAVDHEGYEFARSAINANGGIPFSLITAPSIFVGDEPDARLESPAHCVNIVPFNEWSAWLEPHLADSQDDLLVNLLEAFFIMNDPEKGRNSFASYCLQKSLCCPAECRETSRGDMR